ncbi:unnamed protein product [Adineta steineri]|uniref:Uncharacterized protein n=1 Tax=Adineta steineri TaxID=433720 RepID=A0A813NYP8_9BILA|nr:unnamed protein product [Adineta steineri]CAF3876511.1 unnamed protein product [Adineta steineri]
MVSTTTIQPATVFAWFMLMINLRRVVLLIIATIIGRNKPFPSGSRVPEDKILRKCQVEPMTTGINHTAFTKDIRIYKTISNDAENDVYFIIILLATALYIDTVSGDCTRTIIYGAIYLFFRILYAIAYIMALQPFRSIAFFLSLACTLTCNLDLVITISRRSN